MSPKSPVLAISSTLSLPIEAAAETFAFIGRRGSRDTYLQRLAARRLIEPCGSGQVRAVPGLFEEAPR